MFPIRNTTRLETQMETATERIQYYNTADILITVRTVKSIENHSIFFNILNFQSIFIKSPSTSILLHSTAF